MGVVTGKDGDDLARRAGFTGDTEGAQARPSPSVTTDNDDEPRVKLTVRPTRGRPAPVSTAVASMVSVARADAGIVSASAEAMRQLPSA